MLVFSTGFLFGQYREYHLLGLVIDSQEQPLAGVEIILQDVSTSRNYRVKTDKNGKYVLSGLPHGKYQVTVKKMAMRLELSTGISQPRRKECKGGNGDHRPGQRATGQTGHPG